MKEYLRKVPGLRYAYIKVRGSLLMVTKPVLDALLKFHGVSYNMWDVISTKNCDFLKDPGFAKGYEVGQKQENLPNFDAWKIHINQWAAHHAMRVGGDFVECGVYRGRMAMATANYIDFAALSDRQYYLFDTFTGLDAEFSTAQELQQYKFAYPDSYEFVKKSFEQYPNVVIIKGPVPTTLSQVDILKVAYLSIDMNAVFPEVKALEFFWPKLVPGGIVILDDYAQMCHEHQKKAMDQFAVNIGVKILSLPTGQGVLIKA